MPHDSKQGENGYNCDFYDGVHISPILISNHLHPATITTIFEHGFLLAFKMNRLGD